MFVRACVQIFADLSNQGTVESREEGYVQRCAGTVLFKFRSVLRTTLLRKFVED